MAAEIGCIKRAAEISFRRGPVRPKGDWRNLPNDLPGPFLVYRVEIEGQLLCEAAEFLVLKADDPVAFIAEEIRGAMLAIGDG